MAIRAVFPTGQNKIETSPLYQWDYGQMLEIESTDLTAIVEVHFACRGMDEAVIHTCSVDNNVATVQIPNVCLEQTTPITAWVFKYENDGTSGSTIKTITIPVIERTRPKKSNEIPQTICDRYTELIAEVEELVDALKAGDIHVATADRANYAVAAGTANTANTASTATHATEADMAACDSAGRIIADFYPSRNEIPKRLNYQIGSPWFTGGEEYRSFELGDAFRSVDQILAVCVTVTNDDGYQHLYSGLSSGKVVYTTDGDMAMPITLTGGGYATVTDEKDATMLGWINVQLRETPGHRLYFDFIGGFGVGKDVSAGSGYTGEVTHDTIFEAGHRLEYVSILWG